MKNFFEPIFQSQVKENETLQRSEAEPTPEQLREKLQDPNFLPTREQIEKAFVNDEQWNKFHLDNKKPSFEFFNREYVAALANYFIARAKELGASREKPIIILEICAGNGRLTHFLKEKITSECNGEMEIIATDSGDWKIKHVFPVESLNLDDALKKYNPQIVVCSWMPPGLDLTEEIRQTASVQEYILIGDAENDCCGDAWKTYGWQTWHRDDYYEDEDGNGYYGDPNKIPPFEEDGFKRERLDDLSHLQNYDRTFAGILSGTYSFKREK